MSWAEQAMRQLAPQIEAFTENSATIVRDEVVALMEESSPSGVHYKSRGHRASAEGEPPAVEDGDYIESWKVSPPEQRGSQVMSGAYTDLMADDGRELRGVYLEYGTHAMGARPHVGPGTDRARIRVNHGIRRINRRSGR